MEANLQLRKIQIGMHEEPCDTFDFVDPIESWFVGTAEWHRW
jgi:hypothetical protein